MLQHLKTYSLPLLAICLAGIFISTLPIIGSLTTSIQALSFPYELSYGEGAIWSQVLRLQAGEALYINFNEAPYLVTNYPPFFHYLVLVASKVANSPLIAGRYISFISLLFSMICITGIIWKSSGRGHLANLLGSIIAAAILLTVIPAEFAHYMRVDSLAVALNIFGIFCCLSNSRRICLLGIAAFVLAFFTKQAAIAGILALLIFAVRKKLQNLAFYIGIYLVSVAAIFLSFYLATDGLFWNNIVLANSNKLILGQLTRYFSVLGELYPAYIAVSFAVIIYFFIQSSKETKVEFPISNNLVIRRELTACYFAASWLLTLLSAKIGSDYNYFIEAFAASSLAIGIFLAQSFPNYKTSLKQSSLFMLVFVLFVFQSVFSPAALSRDLQKLAQEQDLDKITQLLKTEPRPILSDDLGIILASGKKVYFQPFVMTQLSLQKIWNQEAFISEIKNQAFSKLILQFPLNSETLNNSLARHRFTKEMIKTFSDHYTFDREIGSYWIYKPALHMTNP